MKIETKYSIGDEVWFMWGNKPTKRKVSLLHVSADGDGIEVTYYVDDREIEIYFEEVELFETKKGVIESLWDEEEDEEE